MQPNRSDSKHQDRATRKWLDASDETTLGGRFLGGHMKKRLSLAAAAVALVASLVPATSATAQTTPLKVKITANLGREVHGFTTRPMVPLVDGIPTVQIH